MAKPTTRQEFKEYCLRKLGDGVIDINISDEQVDDRIDEALSFYADYHFDGAEKVYYKHQITETDRINKYIIVPDNILGAVSIFPLGDMSMNSNDIFNIQYQIALNDLYTLTSVSMIPYYMAMTHLNLIQDMLVGQIPIRYNRHMNRLYIDTDWNRIGANQYLLVEAYQVVDPEEYSDVWSDRWLQNYCTAKLKFQWGSNLTKFTNMSLPGGVQFNGERILQDAQEEIAKMEQEMLVSYSLPPLDMLGPLI